MKKVLIVLLAVLIAFAAAGALAFRKNKHFSTTKYSSYETITLLNEKITSKADAEKYFKLWLTKETDFNDKSNGISSIEKYMGYYEIKLETAVLLKHSAGQKGYCYYVVTKDGELRGYVLSK